MVEVLPRLRNLSSLQISNLSNVQPPFNIIQIPNFLEVLDSNHQAQSSTVFNTNVKQVRLGFVPWIWNREDIISNRKALVSKLVRFLKYFKNVYILNFVDAVFEFPELGYALTKNGVGRRLIEGYDCNNDDSEAGGSNRKIGTNRDTSPHLPASVWPILLERAQSKVNPFHRDIVRYHRGTEHIASGVYYLLREGPVLLEHHNLSKSGRKKLKRATADKTSSDMHKNDEWRLFHTIKHNHLLQEREHVAVISHG